MVNVITGRCSRCAITRISNRPPIPSTNRPTTAPRKAQRRSSIAHPRCPTLRPVASYVSPNASTNIPVLTKKENESSDDSHENETTPTRLTETPDIRDRTRLYGHVRLLWAEQRETINCYDSLRRGARRNSGRHCGYLWAVHERRACRSRHPGP